MFRHPKYYKELRKRNKVARGQGRSNSELTDPASISDQAISLRSHDGERERSPGPGPKRQAASAKQQASSVKPQAPEDTSDKHQAPSSKRQA